MGKGREECTGMSGLRYLEFGWNVYVVLEKAVAWVTYCAKS